MSPVIPRKKTFQKEILLHHVWLFVYNCLSDIAPRLMRVNYEKPAAEAELMVADIRKAADLIDASTSNKQKENYVLIWYIRTGLSSVLDLVDHSSSSQKSLFSDEAWTQITSQFESELSLELLPISRILTSSWLIISTAVVSSNNITLGLNYIYKIYSKQNNQNENYLKLFEHVLTRNGLYVYHPAYSFSLPSCIEELGSFKPIMQKLLSFQQHVITISNILEKAFGKHEEADKDGEATSILNWRRDTFYTPPKNKEARVPLVLFGSPSSNLVLRLIKTKYSEGEEGVVYDQFGWGKKNDKWHNKITNETQDENPYSEE
ncbi:uncharacterized protein EV154DRAFT_603965 [Mucor mucedo]|uniref:uncharacterized protein n=1 Tax=Mucor mucedo TaxID=29922 RepID=UPI00221FE54F|nr:uncharacterized protein EV154DRAFT_603965 [Mucor mucedo]KAI7889494.1 hypothetical protein EV154DRAFT_603965 [Mucor mucedo]